METVGTELVGRYGSFVVGAHKHPKEKSKAEQPSSSSRICFSISLWPLKETIISQHCHVPGEGLSEKALNNAGFARVLRIHSKWRIAANLALQEDICMLGGASGSILRLLRKNDADATPCSGKSLLVMIIFKPAAASGCRHARTLLSGVAIRASYNRTVAPALGSICWYSETPTPSQETVSYLRNWKNGAHLYLVGTAHISALSAEQVRQVINEVKPDAIAVELCEARAKSLQSENRPPKNVIELLKIIFGTKGGPGEKLLGLAMHFFYERLRTLGLEPGKEFQVAIQEAERLGIKLYCIDQDVDVTMQRLWDALSVRDLFRLYTQVPKPWVHQTMAASRTGNPGEWVESIKTREVVRAMFQDMEAAAPNVVRVLVHERDEVMAKQLRQYEGTIVGVVGMAHMDGIERRWREADQEADRSS